MNFAIFSINTFLCYYMLMYCANEIRRKRRNQKTNYFIYIEILFHGQLQPSYLCSYLPYWHVIFAVNAADQYNFEWIWKIFVDIKLNMENNVNTIDFLRPRIWMSPLDLLSSPQLMLTIYFYVCIADVQTNWFSFITRNVIKISEKMCKREFREDAIIIKSLSIAENQNGICIKIIKHFGKISHAKKNITHELWVAF